MNEDQLKQKITSQVLGKVRAKTVRMRPRAYFMVRAAAAAFVACCVLVISSFVLSFIFFGLHETGEQFLLGFGFRGVETFLMLFPWWQFALDIVLILLLEWLLQGFKLGYRLSILTLFAGVFALSAIFAALLYVSPIHPYLLDRADNGRLPLIGGMYRELHDSHTESGLFRGTVVSMQNDTVTIKHNDNDRDADDGLRVVRVPQGNMGQMHLGMHVFVFGTSTGQEVEPYGIREFDGNR